MIRGIWMWPNNIYTYGAQKIVSVLKNAGFTDIYFLTKGLSGKTSYLSNYAPAAFDRDLLEELVSCAHFSGIRVHAWFTSASDENYKALHPKSGRCHFKRGKDQGLISFKDKGYQQYLKSIIDEVVRKYPIDGVHLDYIRYNHMLYGWDDMDTQGYQAMGAHPEELFSFIENAFFSDHADKGETMFKAYRAGNPSLKAFYESRKKDVTDFAVFMLKDLRLIRQNLILSAAVMPEGAYQDAAFSDLHYGQVYSELAPLFDYLVPMAYSQAYEKDASWITEIGQSLEKKRISFVMGIQAYDNVSGTITQNDTNAAIAASAMGFAVFREGACAIVYQKDGFCIFNDTPDPVTKVELRCPPNTEIRSVSIAPGETAILHFKNPPDQILLYSDDHDICVFYAKSDFV